MAILPRALGCRVFIIKDQNQYSVIKLIKIT